MAGLGTAVAAVDGVEEVVGGTEEVVVIMEKEGTTEKLNRFSLL